ncbi:MAG: aminotransferase class I/II-fold pyridoxal phosphate-dependent enzyme [Eubacteriales bacterium]|nr:aminotransferase class I/II-fold pyridoxal phosphate-dependent enzyme [Eubacteriales bacterium]
MKSKVSFLPQSIIILEHENVKQNKTPLLDAMLDYKNKNCTPFDVPGHKYGRGAKELVEIFGEKALSLDFNSMKPLDMLSSPTSVIKEAESLLAEAYGADNGYFVVNGTSSAVKSMIMAVCKPGDKIIIPRNAHKSVVSALIMSGAIPVYIQPEYDVKLGIFHGVDTAKAINTINENADAKAIFLINPTYYGAVSELTAIVEHAHRFKMAVLVDEAHGAHLGFHGELPSSAMEAGADASAVSTHKTGGSLTQSSAIVSRNGLIQDSQIRKYLNINGTTSSSYLLMGSIDAARKNLALNGQEILRQALDIARFARDEINKIPGFYAFGKEIVGRPGVYGFDETKLVINSCKMGITGFELYDILRDRYNIQMELGDTYNTLAVISLGDTYESAQILIDALRHIASNNKRNEKYINHLKNVGELEVRMSPRDAFYSETERIKLKESAGRISCESIMAYPPGIPIVTPGEAITGEVIEYALHLKDNNALITDVEDIELNYIQVVK